MKVEVTEAQSYKGDEALEDSSFKKDEVVELLSHERMRLWVYGLDNDLKIVVGSQEEQLD